jgi:hypothetical protein
MRTSNLITQFVWCDDFTATNINKVFSGILSCCLFKIHHRLETISVPIIRAIRIAREDFINTIYLFFFYKCINLSINNNSNKVTTITYDSAHFIKKSCSYR